MELQNLANKFKAEDIEWRIGNIGETGGRVWATCLAYITNRAIMDRLDEVCGVGGWKNHFEKAPDGGILCGISIKIDNEWVTKWDGAESTQIEAVKGGLSNSMKRAGVQWGIGRYLYDLEKTYVVINNNGNFSAKDKKGNWFKWSAPKLPGWALPIEKKEADRKKLAYELDLLLSEEGKEMTDNEKKQIARFFCNTIKAPVLTIEQMPVDMLTRFTAKVDDVFKAFLDSLKQ